MIDFAVQVLLAEISSHLDSDQGNCLLVLDEQIDVKQLLTLQPHPALTIITNRCDQAARLAKREFNVKASDYDFSEFAAGSFSAVFHRMSKQKALVHYTINQCAHLLTGNGALHVTGFKNEGTKTYIDKACKYLGGAKKINKLAKNVYSAVITKVSIGQPLDDSDYTTLRPAMTFTTNAVDTEFVSKPGVYGWQKVDKGSTLLVAQLQQLMNTYNKPEFKVLDLGCGYGFISVMAAQMANMNITATDNNLTAISACQANFASHNIAGEVIAADVGEGIRGKYDFVLCNPPFHKGFEVNEELTERFLSAAVKVLRPKGCALFVVNEFIPLPKKAIGIFEHCEELTTENGFKVFRLTN
jgi:16S rRNA (guanine1207-N2)-methyltransferase|tara:strand:+ start:23 stop:1090 length:1068 start_codon:yes stop_codon:yes gene_type:complete